MEMKIKHRTAIGVYGKTRRDKKHLLTSGSFQKTNKTGDKKESGFGNLRVKHKKRNTRSCEERHSEGGTQRWDLATRKTGGDPRLRAT